jgi:hypothetical protein
MRPERSKVVAGKSGDAMFLRSTECGVVAGALADPIWPACHFGCASLQQRTHDGCRYIGNLKCISMPGIASSLSLPVLALGQRSRLHAKIFVPRATIDVLGPGAFSKRCLDSCRQGLCKGSSVVSEVGCASALSFERPNVPDRPLVATAGRGGGTEKIHQCSGTAISGPNKC